MKLNVSMKKTILIGLLFIGLISCTNMSEKTGNDKLNGMNFPNFQEKHSGLVNFINHNDTIFIKIEFSDCGEWGGHIELLRIFRNHDKKLIGHLKIDSVSCENIKDFGNYSDLDDKTREIVRTIEKELSADDEKLVNLFIHRILELKLNFESSTMLTEENEEFIPIFIDAGTVIEIRNSNSTFLIDYYNRDESANTWYGKIRKEIFGLKIKKKTATNT